MSFIEKYLIKQKQNHFKEADSRKLVFNFDLSFKSSINSLSTTHKDSNYYIA